MVLPKTHLDFDIRNNFPFNSFLNRVRKPCSNTIWVLNWSHLVSVLFYKVWRCSAPPYAWQLQACTRVTRDRVLQPWVICGIYLGSVSCADLKQLGQTDPATSFFPPILLPVCLLLTPSLQAHPRKASPRLTRPWRDQRTLQLEGVVFTLIIQLLLFFLWRISGFPQKGELFWMPDVWEENGPFLPRQDGKKGEL